MRYLGFLAVAVLLSASCDKARIFELNVDLGDNVWPKDSVLVFDIGIEDPNIPYNIYYNIRNTASYPFYNLYLNHTIKSTIGSVISTNLDEIFLFDQETGEPMGSGMGDIFDHQVMVLKDFRFPSKGTYQFSTQQYMRDDQLPHIMSVGIRVEVADG